MDPAPPEITICDDLEEVSRRGALEFAQTAGDSINKQGVFRVALSGGSTPMAMYRLLATDEFRERVDWAKVIVFFGDERCVPPGDDESNFKAADDALLNKVPIPEGNIHRIRADRGEAAAHEYEEEIKLEFDLSEDELPRFDLMLLGMGADGHIASIFPGSPALNETKRLAMAVKPPGVKTTRITLTPPVINNAKKLIFLLSGSNKSRALATVLRGNLDPEKLPAQITRASKGRVKWLVDRAAANEFL